MIIKRAKHVSCKLLKYYLWEDSIIKKKVIKSFSKNFFLLPKIRLSYIVQKNFFNKDRRFYKSQCKLQCLHSYSFSVPYKRVLASRFELTRSLEHLKYSGYQK